MHWVPHRCAPDPPTARLLARATEAAHAMGAGYVGLEHLLLVRDAPDDTDAIRACVIPWASQLQLSLPLRSPDTLTATPRLLAVFGRLPRSFGLQQLWQDIERNTGPAARLAVRGLPIQNHRKVPGATIATFGLPNDERPNELEVVGGPEDGRALLPLPGDSIGGESARVPLYANTSAWDRHLAPDHLIWLGAGHVLANQPVRVLRALGAGIPEVLQGRIELTTDAILELSPSTRLRAAAPDPGLAFRTEAVSQGPLVSPPRQIAGRYHLIDVLGWGGMATVYAASDDLTGQIVALKVAKGWTDGQLAQSRREVTVLRCAQLPGVVELLDDGVASGWCFLVMTKVDGTPFPCRDTGGTPWAELRPLLSRLLEVVARVHTLGIIHGDLKPENVIVAEGRITLLDFGLARPSNRRRDSVGAAGTPTYWAPEQARGEAADQRSDVYSLGVMTYEALVGRPPRLHAHTLLDGPRPSADEILALAPGLPPHAAALLEAMLDLDPHNRPATVVEVANRLWVDGAPFDRPEVRIGAFHQAPDLEHLFEGPEAFHHLKSDAALALFSRISPDPDSALDELAAWIRAGIANFHNGRFSVRRVDLNRLLAGDRLPISTADADRLRSLAMPEDIATSLDLLAERAVKALRDSNLHEAAAWSELGLRLDPDGVGGVKRDLLRIHTLATMEGDTHQELLRAIYELDRAADRDNEMESLRSLVRALRTHRSGEAERSRHYLSRVAPLDGPSFEEFDRIRRHLSIRLHPEPSSATFADELAEHLEWAQRGNRSRKAWGHSLASLAAFLAGAFSEAISHAKHAIDTPECPAAVRQDALVLQAQAELESFLLEAAHRTALRVQADARRRRHASREATGALTARCAEYRMRRWSVSSLENIEAADAIHRTIAGSFAIQEAAHAWRCGDTARAQHLLRFAAHRVSSLRPDLPPLLRALLAVVSSTCPTVDDLKPATATRFPEVRLQTLALMARTMTELPGPLRVEATELLARTQPQGPPDSPIDFLSWNEILADLARKEYN